MDDFNQAEFDAAMTRTPEPGLRGWLRDVSLVLDWLSCFVRARRSDG